MPPADLDAFPPQQVAQHPAARERIVQVQLVHAPHDRQIGRANRPGQIIDATSADPQFLRLPRYGQAVRTIDYRFAFVNRPALPSASAKKSFASVNSPILACNVFTSTAGSADSAALSAPKKLQPLPATGRATS